MSWCEYNKDCWKAAAYQSHIKKIKILIDEGIDVRENKELLDFKEMQYMDCNHEHKDCLIRKELGDKL